MTIYLDILLFINFYISYFEILAVCCLSHTDIGFTRRIIGSAVGAVFAFTVFIPERLWIISAVVKVASCFIMATVVFGVKSFGRFLRYSLYLLVVSFVFAGACLFVWLFIKPRGMLYRGGALYLDIDVMVLLITAVISYLAIKLVRMIMDKRAGSDREYTVTVCNLGNTRIMSGFADSGNSAVDYFSGLPVIVCKKESCEGVYPPIIEHLISHENNISDIQSFGGIRILPCTTVCGEGLLYAFKADSITIKETGGNGGHRVNALIGIAPDSHQSFDAIFSPKLLI